MYYYVCFETILFFYSIISKQLTIFKKISINNRILNIACALFHPIKISTLKLDFIEFLNIYIGRIK